MRVTILGAGAMGSALTVPLCDNGNEVNLWGTKYDKKILNALFKEEAHPRISTKLPTKVKIFPPDKLKGALKDSKIVVIGVNSEGVLPIAKEIVPLLKENMILITIAKGLLVKAGGILMVEEGLRKELPRKIRETIPIVSVGGPSIAKAIANKSMSAVVYASKNVNAAKAAKKIFQTSYYRVEVSDDIKGLEICSALKNVYSIALGWLEGLTEKRDIGKASNAKAVLFLQILREMKKITIAIGGNPETAMGLVGLGDLITTSATGRNGMFGKLLGTGLNTTEALGELKKRGVGVVEGYETTNKAYKFAKILEKDGKISVNDFLLLKGIYSVLYENKSVEKVLKEVYGA